MRTSQHLVIVAIEVDVIRLVRVRAYKRVRFGKVERGRSHYRRYYVNLTYFCIINYQV